MAEGPKYHFKNRGVIRDIIPPAKAIIVFKLNGRDEKAILLSKNLSVNGKSWDELPGRPFAIAEVLKIGDEVEFDCHVYDKGGGIGSGKDKCNYFAMKAAKNTRDYVEKMGLAAQAHHQVGMLSRSSNTLIAGTGWISELSPRKGVLTFEHNNRAERVLFLASRVWFFEKRLGTKQSLTDFCSEADPLQFEAVPTTNEIARDLSDNCHCNWFATMAYKGKRPQGVEDQSAGSSVRRGSNDKENESGNGNGVNSGSSSANSNGMEDASSPKSAAPAAFPNGVVNSNLNVIRGAGQIARVISERSGVIWWLKGPNHLQSVWFEAKQAFLLGDNLADKNLYKVFKEGESNAALLYYYSPPNLWLSLFVFQEIPWYFWPRGLLRIFRPSGWRNKFWSTNSLQPL